MVTGSSDARKAILLILEDLGAATTAEIIEEASIVSKECKDRVPQTLIALEKEGKVKKSFSKEKKAIIWAIMV